MKTERHLVKKHRIFQTVTIPDVKDCCHSLCCYRLTWHAVCYSTVKTNHIF